MDKQDIRWKQRFSNYCKALDKLEDSVKYIREHSDVFLGERKNGKEDVITNLIQQGLIQSFEYTHELAWNVMKDYADYQGNTLVRGSRDASREALQMRLITDGEVWMEMIKSRNTTSHTYDEDIATEIFFKIINEYFPAFKDFHQTMKEIMSNE